MHYTCMFNVYSVCVQSYYHLLPIYKTDYIMKLISECKWVILIPYNVGSGCLYSSEEQEQPQRKGNAQVEVDKVVKLLNQLLSAAVEGR